MTVIMSKPLCRSRRARVNEMAFHNSRRFDSDVFRIGGRAEGYHVASRLAETNPSRLNIVLEHGVRGRAMVCRIRVMTFLRRGNMSIGSWLIDA